jgi:hypothetical protein
LLEYKERKEGAEITARARRKKKGMGQRRKKVRSRRGQPCRKKRLLHGKCRVPKGKSIK